MTKQYRFISIILWLTLLFSQAQATLSGTLQGLVSQGNTLDANLSSFSFESGSSCSQLGTLNTSVEEYIESIETLTAQLGEPLSLTQEELTSLDDLSALGCSMAEESVRIALELSSLDATADLFEYRAGLEAVLRLSDGIGTMADRILEMADRILLMADNIGAMADKIVYTIGLQSANMAFIQTAMLATQENMVQLNGSFSSIAYNLTLGQVASDGSALLSEMNATVLTETNMAGELGRLGAQAALLETAVVDLYVFAGANSATASHYINGDTLTYFTDLSGINLALAKSIEAFTESVSAMAPMTQIPVLADATAAVLRLTQDIKVMADRIMEMSVKIIVMADNIGLMGDRIVEVQGLMNADMGLTEASINASQSMTVGLIESYGL